MTFEEVIAKFEELEFMEFRALTAALPLGSLVKLGEQALNEKKWMLSNSLFLEASMKMSKLSLFAMDQFKEEI
jgi:hypothetical protein